MLFPCSRTWPCSSPRDTSPRWGRGSQGTWEGSADRWPGRNLKVQKRSKCKCNWIGIHLYHRINELSKKNSDSICFPKTIVFLYFLVSLNFLLFSPPPFHSPFLLLFWSSYVQQIYFRLPPRNLFQIRSRLSIWEKSARGSKMHFDENFWEKIGCRCRRQQENKARCYIRQLSFLCQKL